MEKLRYWKNFSLGDLFELSTGTLSKPLKDLEIADEHDLKIISSSEFNNGVVGNVDSSTISESKHSNKITLNRIGSTGFAFYHNYEFIGTDKIKILNLMNSGIDSLIVKHSHIGNFISKMISKIFAGSGIFSFQYGINNNTFNREQILLPVIQTDEANSIWEDDNDGETIHLTLDVDFIKEMMDKAKERKEERTIRHFEREKAKYELEKAKYELEKAKYENDPVFMEKYGRYEWKSYKLGDLFEFKNDTVLSQPNKNLDISPEITKSHNIALVSTSSKNNGIVGYIDSSQSEGKEKNGFLTLDKLFGNCFYQEDPYVNVAIWNIGYINIVKSDEFSFQPYADAYRFLSKSINKISIKSGIYGYSYTFSWERFCREIILLPYVNNGIDSEIMGYLYNLGMIKNFERKIDFYNDSVGEKLNEL